MGKKCAAGPIAGDTAEAAERRLVSKLRKCEPKEQRMAYDLAARNIDQATLPELLRFYSGEHSSTLEQSARLDVRAISLLAVLGLMGTIFFSSSSMVFQHISEWVVIIAGLSLLVAAAVVIACSLAVTWTRKYHRINDGYLLNVKPHKNQEVGADFDINATFCKAGALEQLLDPSFDRLAYLRKNLLELVVATAENRKLNWTKAKWLTRAQKAFLVFFLVLALSAIAIAIRIGALHTKGTVPTPIEQGEPYSPHLY